MTSSQMLFATRKESGRLKPVSLQRSKVHLIAPDRTPSWAPSKLVTAIEVSTSEAAPGTAAHWGAPVRNFRRPSLPSPASKGPSRENMPKYALKASPRSIHSSTPNRAMQTKVTRL